MLPTFAALFLLQSQDTPARMAENATTRTPPAVASSKAVRAMRPIVLDGRADDEVWRDAPPITEFVEFDPTEGKPPRFRTEARVAYDQRNFYVFIRMFDPERKRSSSCWLGAISARATRSRL
jgi:hypothetical protein